MDTISLRKFRDSVQDISEPTAVLKNEGGVLRRLGVWTPEGSLAGKPSFENAEGEELFDGTIPAPMRETVRTIESVLSDDGMTDRRKQTVEISLPIKARSVSHTPKTSTTIDVPTEPSYGAKVGTSAGPRDITVRTVRPVPKPSAKAKR